MKMIKGFFEKMGVFLVDLLKLDEPGRGKPELRQEIIALSGGGKSAVRKYYIKKTAIFLFVIVAGVLLSLTGLVIYSVNKKETRVEALERPGYGEGDRKEALTVQIEGEEQEEQIEITVQERKYTDEEKQQLLDAALEQLEQILPGKNESLDEVRSDLVFPESLENGAVKASWLTIPYGIIGDDGSLKGAEDEAGTLVEIQGTLTCDGQEASCTMYAKVFPPILPEEEQVLQSIQKEVEQADARDSNTELLKLPDSAGGKQLIWNMPEENPFPVLLVLTLIFASGIYMEMDSRVHKKAEMRKQQMMLDYPDLMWKMTMLLGAGLSIKGTFSRISGEYLQEKNSSSPKAMKKTRIRYIYEEVAYTCYEMENGISEAQAYERFGKRCQLPEYIRLGAVLSQNLKKGAKGLTSLLETEAEASMNERRNHARKIGEQAGTRLLLPMILMLGIVLIILMVPAFLSF